MVFVLRYEPIEVIDRPFVLRTTNGRFIGSLVGYFASEQLAVDYANTFPARVIRHSSLVQLELF